MGNKKQSLVSSVRSSRDGLWAPLQMDEVHVLVKDSDLHSGLRLGCCSQPNIFNYPEPGIDGAEGRAQPVDLLCPGLLGPPLVMRVGSTLPPPSLCSDLCIIKSPSWSFWLLLIVIFRVPDKSPLTCSSMSPRGVSDSERSREWESQYCWDVYCISSL